jgi:hypothetical protein
MYGKGQMSPTPDILFTVSFPALPTKHHQKYHMRTKKNNRTYSRELSRASGKLVVSFERRASPI